MAWLLPVLILALFLTVGAVAMRGLANRGSVSAGPTTTLANAMTDQAGAGEVDNSPATNTPEPTNEPLSSPTLAAGTGRAEEGVAAPTVEPKK